MSLDKVLHKIQGQINELAPLLEAFVEETIQPSVRDCENLQKQLVMLQENLAVYKYDKLNKEISPSFNIHAKVSATERIEEKIILPPPQIKEIVQEEKVKQQPVEIKHEEAKPLETKPFELPKQEPVKQRQPLAIGLNDKFRFIKTLFSENSSEYNIALEQLSNLNSWRETEIYLNSLKNLYNWDDESDAVKHFYSIVKKRFN